MVFGGLVPSHHLVIPFNGTPEGSFFDYPIYCCLTPVIAGFRTRGAGKSPLTWLRGWRSGGWLLRFILYYYGHMASFMVTLNSCGAKEMGMTLAHDITKGLLCLCKSLDGSGFL